MITRRLLLSLLASSAVVPFAKAAETAMNLEGATVPPGPPMTPRVINLAALGREPGKRGGTARMLIGGQRDIRLMPINGYARLIGYDEHLNPLPDLLEKYEVEHSQVFTFHLREGHRWSDGSPFTTEDFRYVWEDMFHNKELHRGGIPAELIVNGAEPRFEILDELTVRYSWDAPNPDFLAQQAAPSPTRLMMPSAYMKQFHAKYQDAGTLAKLIKANRVEDWSSLHQNKGRTVRPENPDLPTLDPWRNRTAPPAQQFIFERNPHFHRIDENGVQLPYIDRFVLNVSSPGLIAAKAGSGESELQLANIDFADYTFLKSSEQRFPVHVNLWKRTQGSRIALMPNLTCKDDIWRGLFRDVRVRRALSLAIDRSEINKASFYGIAKESANTILPESRLYRKEYAEAYIAHDPHEANRLLDEAGLARRNEKGFRLLSDGRIAQIVIETAGEDSFESDVLELVADHWYKVGIAIHVRASSRELFRSRIRGGETIMCVWPGIDNGVPTADMSPKELAPTSDDQLQWANWGLHYLSGGSDGRPPDMPEPLKLLDLLADWRRSGETAEREKIWHEMLSIYTDQVFTIGIVNAALQPVVSSSRLRNMPSRGLFCFDPYSYLGVYMPDTFWFGESA
ncbi:ABC transporter substrate-binding protein [Neorhizobium sp. JUb45]|uniref:ABC transporter substrate-binding protein n=1 Tax=unclassified Neorhizobium TaxID=2629175 RepID=UPI00105333B9|nr:ABC transporter substrate-binding protein [Neorhizobium sp. JUb45]TCQ99749.1 peptide/nickel transport system substrate-binding protein [Neorhizobium sp. JUb45]